MIAEPALAAEAKKPQITRWHVTTVVLLGLGYAAYYFCRSDYSVLPHAQAAIRLRRWDDEAKIEALPTPSLDNYLPHLLAASRTV